MGGTALFSNPLLCTRGTATTGMDIFWADTEGSIRQLWELRQPMRCDDPWYNSILNMFRDGRLDMNDYSMLHGFPTAIPGSWNPTTAKTPCSCGKDARLLPGCTHTYYKTSWAQMFLDGYSGAQIIEGTLAAELRGARECRACITTRKKRQRVLPFGAVPEAKLHEEPFCSAPAIFSYNVPKYCAVHRRVVACIVTRLAWICEF